MEYLFVLLATFIAILFLMQLVFFEITRKKMKNNENINWFLSLKQPFSYHRIGYMIFICSLCYIISGPDGMFSAEWFLYLVLFVAMGVIADAVVQYLITAYSKWRCRHEIQESTLLENELLAITQNMTTDTYIESDEQYDDESLLQHYLQPEDHLAIISIDKGEFANRLNSLPEATFVVEPFGDIHEAESKFVDKPVKVTQLTQSGQLPFKDEKMDILLCEHANYDKFEIQRVLKPNGYTIINQRGTTNLKEFYQIYMPFGMKGSWDAYSCAETLENAGFKIIDKRDDYGTVRFHSVQGIHTYFQKIVPDYANIHKYKVFYLKVLMEIKKKSFFELSTHRFYVIAQKVS